MTTSGLRCSVVVPVHDGGPLLARALDALAASDLPRDTWELIVVDDASRDDSAVTSAAHADSIIRLPGTPMGPAYARNRGAEVAHAPLLVFVDADVLVRPDTLRRLCERLEGDETVAAAVAGFDAAPPVSGVGRYHNLVLHVTHRTHDGDLDAFWASCGAVRREVFASVRMFNEWHFRAPEVEDLELGMRLRAAGHRIVRAAGVEVTHGRGWSAGTLLSTLWWRGATVTRTRLGRADVMPGPATVFSGLARARGVSYAAATMPLHLAARASYRMGSVCGWLLAHTVGEPRPHPSVEAYAEVGVETWPPVPTRR